MITHKPKLPRPCSEPKCKCEATQRVRVNVAGETYIHVHLCDEHAKQYAPKAKVG